MKKIHIFILFALSIQISYANDGWWEKIGTKHLPTLRILPSLDIVTENKVIMFGGSGYADEGKDSLNQNEFWIFDYEQKDWILTDIKYPFPYNKALKFNYHKGNMVNLYDGTMLVTFGEKSSDYKMLDSSLYTLDVFNQKWTLIRQAFLGPASKSHDVFYFKLKDSFVLGAVSGSSMGFWDYYNHSKYSWSPTNTTSRPENTDCAQISNGKVLIARKGYNYLPYDPNIPIDDQDFKFYYMEYPKYNPIPILRGNDSSYLYVNSIFSRQHAVNIGVGKVKFVHSFLEYLGLNGEFSKQSHLFDFSNLDKPVRIMNIDTIGPPAETRNFAICKLAKDKILFYGGWISPGNSALPEIIPHQTWVFHIDPSITNIETTELGGQFKIKKLLIDKSFSILTLNDKILNHKLIDLMGNSIPNYTIEEGILNTKVQLDVPNGAYSFTFELINGDKYNYLLLVNHL